MKINSLIQLLVILEECPNPDAVVTELEQVLHSSGFEYYGLLRHLQQSPAQQASELRAASLAGRWPEQWLQIYAAKKYVRIDPMVRYLAHAQRPFRWRESMAAFHGDAHQRRMEQMMVDAFGHGLEDGYLFPIHGRGGILGSLSLGGKPIDLSPVEIALLEAVARKAFWRLLDLTGEAEALETVLPTETPLTRREMEILHYLAEGMTSMEISKMLKISNHTVDWYMNGLQDKLKAKNRQQAVALAFRHGLIS
ncbi:helix-turn-helix transcriptional regulator [Rhizobium bangladeshense]|uniref:LuxR family transcriptional regulator n=1 Tax=Rhizobium bangladeshense TaxID=1138189 RepID=A0ABS7LQS6_9HYPH|nr:LuxR family transcriptional regulator [Rhizobium bangladeshense]MBX4869072.1 LuxR family transcriptional regulator [Rhizobium bangladeshense]MBX4873091.1 LuxR family transcriptional regulator [Rhizobium bangladeshense]MBX4884468.1 LuxR family transcriptional regulator [Rhizobium bangladeshense]MBX4904439.1 LuxR family transcriptional regulator [Rhizobium bangladeshense]MBX4916745.1 LuxR family transcriptional regulator [Rhizobium bangladeshense]